MNKQEFKKLWDNRIIPSFEVLQKQDSAIYIRDGNFDSLCRCYNDIKNRTKKLFMKSETEGKLDRHKINACLAKAIVVEKPISKGVVDGYTRIEEDFLLVNKTLS